MQKHCGIVMTSKQTINTAEFSCEKIWCDLVLSLTRKKMPEQVLSIYLHTQNTFYIPSHPLAISVSLSLITDGERDSLLGQMLTQNWYAVQ